MLSVDRGKQKINRTQFVVQNKNGMNVVRHRTSFQTKENEESKKFGPTEECSSQKKRMGINSRRRMADVNHFFFLSCELRCSFDQVQWPCFLILAIFNERLWLNFAKIAHRQTHTHHSYYSVVQYIFRFVYLYLLLRYR